MTKLHRKGNSALNRAKHLSDNRVVDAITSIGLNPLEYLEEE